MPWDAIAWLADFRRVVAPHGSFQDLRKLVFQTTVEAVRNRAYPHDGRSIPLDDAGQYEALHRGTVFYAATDDLVVPAAQRGAHATAVRVVEADCLEAAHLLDGQGLAPLVLNMASGKTPGGGVIRGAGAQEENLFRRSNLLWSLYAFEDFGTQYGVPRRAGERYPIGWKSGAIYSPRATVFRSSEAGGYDFLPRPYPISVVSVPAIHQPATVERDGRRWLTEEMADATRLKIRAILRVAAHHGHASLVLSAFGCGAYRNPPHHMAALFAEVFAEDEFRGVFRALTFAIIDDHNAWKEHNPEGNVIPFQRALDGLCVGERSSPS